MAESVPPLLLHDRTFGRPSGRLSRRIDGVISPGRGRGPSWGKGDRGDSTLDHRPINLG